MRRWSVRSDVPLEGGRVAWPRACYHRRVGGLYTWRWLSGIALVSSLGCGLFVDFGPDRTFAQPGRAGAGGSVTDGGSGGAGKGGSGGAPDGLCEPDADVIWMKTFGDAFYDLIFHSAPDGAGGLYISGWFDGTIDFGAGDLVSQGSRDFFVARLDVNGDPVWAKGYGTPLFDENGPLLAPHPNGVVLLGTAYTAIDLGEGPHVPDTLDGYVALLDGSGDLIWERWLDGPFEQRGWGGAAVDDESGDVFAAFLYGEQIMGMGQTFSGQGGGDMLVVRLDDEDGTVAAVRNIGATGEDRIHGMTAMPGGRVLVVGHVEGAADLGEGPVSGADRDAFAALYERNLAPVWTRRYAGTGSETIRDVVRGASGDALVVGTFTGSASIDFGAGPLVNPLAYDGGYVARLSATTGIALEQAALPGFNGSYVVREAPGGNALVAGWFDVPMSLGYLDLTPMGSRADAFAISLTPAFLTGSTGEVAWHLHAPSSEDTFQSMFMTLSGDDAVFLHSRFTGTLDIEGCPSRPSAGDLDAFVLKRRL